MKKRIRVFFTFSAKCNGRIFLYRAVKAIDGGYRMEKKGENAKTYQTIMWCGRIRGLITHYLAIRTIYGNASNIVRIHRNGNY